MGCCWKCTLLGDSKARRNRQVSISIDCCEFVPKSIAVLWMYLFVITSDMDARF